MLTSTPISLFKITARLKDTNHYWCHLNLPACASEFLYIRVQESEDKYMMSRLGTGDVFYISAFRIVHVSKRRVWANVCIDSKDKQCTAFPVNWSHYGIHKNFGLISFRTHSRSGVWYSLNASLLLFLRHRAITYRQVKAQCSLLSGR